jgi:hypothetical protein
VQTQLSSAGTVLQARMVIARRLNPVAFSAASRLAARLRSAKGFRLRGFHAL